MSCSCDCLSGMFQVYGSWKSCAALAACLSWPITLCSWLSSLHVSHWCWRWDSHLFFIVVNVHVCWYQLMSLLHSCPKKVRRATQSGSWTTSQECQRRKTTNQTPLPKEWKWSWYALTFFNQYLNATCSFNGVARVASANPTIWLATPDATLYFLECHWHTCLEGSGICILGELHYRCYRHMDTRTLHQCIFQHFTHGNKQMCKVNCRITSFFRDLKSSIHFLSLTKVTDLWRHS